MHAHDAHDTTEHLVLAERRDAALILTLNRADAGNAIGTDTARALARRIESTRGDESIRTIVLTGAGDRYFCTGGDVKAYARLESPAELDQAFGLMRDVCVATATQEQGKQQQRRGGKNLTRHGDHWRILTPKAAREA